MTTTVIVRVRRQGIKHNWVKNENGLFMCPYPNCIHPPGKRSTMSEHVTQKHAEEAGRQVLPFQCDHCGKNYQAKTHLNNHIRDQHEIVRVHCPHPKCNYSAKNKYALYTHYSAKHLSNRTKTTASGEEECIGCQKIMSKQASKYHVATCYVESPFYNGCF